MLFKVLRKDKTLTPSANVFIVCCSILTVFEMSSLRENTLLGMGNPLLDISATVEDDFLSKYEMKANDAILASEKHQNLYSELTENYKADFIAGGSVQNALRVAQWLLEKPKVTTFFGCVGEDKYAKILEEAARKDGVNVQYQITAKQPTGTCAVLLTGKHRSLCANLAAANCFTIDHVRKPENRTLMEKAQYYYISVSIEHMEVYLIYVN